MTDRWLNAETTQFLGTSADRRRKFRDRYGYYHRETVDFFNQRMTPPSRALWIGLDALHRSKGLNCEELLILELDPAGSPPSDSPDVTVLHSWDDVAQQGPLDYILLPYTLQLLDDIQGFLESLRTLVLPHTRILILQYNFLWAPLIKSAQNVSLKAPMPNLNWLNLEDTHSLLTLTGYQSIMAGHRCFMPINFLGLAAWVNRYLAPLPIFQSLCQKSFVVARPAQTAASRISPSVSIVVPARNEAGNIEGLLDRLPVLGSRCEVIFVEGHSRDNTWEVIQNQLQRHPRRHLFALRAMQQTGIGKADAVRLGFTEATGDLFMILDADLSVQPEDLLHFYSALASGNAEFLNGSRLVYQMEDAAMRVLNLFFNKVFAMLISWMIGQSVKDTLCGTKALSRRDYFRIRENLARLAELDPFGDFELLLGASRLNLKISDVPVRYKQRTYGQTNIRRFRNGWELLKMCAASWAMMK